jgi:hypothetical protein
LFITVGVVGSTAGCPVSRGGPGGAGIPRASLPRGRPPRRPPTGPDTHLAALGDVVPVALPRWPQVVSAGDVLVAAGVGLLLVTAGARRRQPPRRAVRSTVLDSESTTVGSYS